MWEFTVRDVSDDIRFRTYISAAWEKCSDLIRSQESARVNFDQRSPVEKIKPIQSGVNWTCVLYLLRIESYFLLYFSFSSSPDVFFPQRIFSCFYSLSYLGLKNIWPYNIPTYGYPHYYPLKRANMKLTWTYCGGGRALLSWSL